MLIRPLHFSGCGFRPIKAHLFKYGLALAFFIFFTGFGFSASYSANWLQLQGLEKEDAPKLKLWGFIQPLYTRTDATPLQAGAWSGQPAAFNMIPPDLKTGEQFQIRRARLGVRGRLHETVNYFLLSEFGQNGVTHNGGGSARLMDASITFSLVPWLHIRVGQFKYPGAEDGLQAIHTHNYLYFTNATNQLLLERFFNGDGSDPNDANSPNGPVGAFRDIGIQLFNSFELPQLKNVEHSFAFMAGNGNGITRGDNNGKKDLYGYLSSEWVFAENGPYRQGLKFFGWIHHGERTLTQAGQGTYDRDRYGTGLTLRKGKYRFFFEYIFADGMIFNGTDGGAVPGNSDNTGSSVASFNIAPVDRAHGWYVDLGYAVIPNWVLDIRYDVLHRLTSSAPGNEREFWTVTLGTQVFFWKKSRLMINYEFRHAEAPGLSSSAGANQILDGMDDRFSIGLITIF